MGKSKLVAFFLGLGLVFSLGCLAAVACSKEADSLSVEESDTGASSSDEKTWEPETDLEKAYYEWITDKVSYVDSVATYKEAGEYSGWAVAVMNWYSDEVSVSEVEVDYYVNEIFVCELGNGSYDVIAYNPENDPQVKDLEEAYNDGDITDGDLEGIISALG